MPSAAPAEKSMRRHMHRVTTKGARVFGLIQAIVDGIDAPSTRTAERSLKKSARPLYPNESSMTVEQCHQAQARDKSTLIHRKMESRQWIRAITLVGVLLGLTSCYPVKQTYFTPTAPTGITVSNECHQQHGPRGTINFKLGFLNLSVMMNSELDYLVLTVYEIDQDEVLFGPEPFVIASRQGSQTIVPKDTYEFEQTARSYRHRVLPYEGGIRMYPGRTYQLIFKELLATEDRFTISMPYLLTKQKKVEIPTITFERITEWRMDLVVLNC